VCLHAAQQQPHHLQLGCCAGISVCTSLGLNLEPLLAVGGAGGIAAGFASPQVLTNIVSGG
jgi:small-conductance mechanosensitive channel